MIATIGWYAALPLVVKVIAWLVAGVVGLYILGWIIAILFTLVTGAMVFKNFK